MFRPMRRSAQALDGGACVEILERGTSGVLALAGDGGWPYAVPLSYVYSDGKLYFHCAKSGHKLDAVRECDKASFCVVARDDVVPEEFTTRYVSVIAFGRVREITGDAECAGWPKSTPPSWARPRARRLSSATWRRFVCWS